MLALLVERVDVTVLGMQDLFFVILVFYGNVAMFVSGDSGILWNLAVFAVAHRFSPVGVVGDSLVSDADDYIPGAQTCHFTLWRATDEEKAQWEGYTRLLEAKALTRAKQRHE